MTSADEPELEAAKVEMPFFVFYLDLFFKGGRIC